jgi:hypothetical protein
MASNREGLGEKIRNILQARQMHDDDLALLDAVMDPVEAHIEGLGHFWGDGGVGNAHGALVITIEWGRRLDMSKICQNLSFVGGYSGVFGRMGRDGVIYPRVVDLGAEEVKGARDAAGVRARQIRGIG